MADIALMWHGSLQWGRRQVSEWHFLAEVYLATLEVLEKHPKVHLTLQFGGQDLEWFSHTHPGLIDRVRELMKVGQVEVSVGGYSHNFQGAVPDLNLANLVFAQRVCRELFGVTADGYWPAESMLNRGMPKSLLEAGFKYTMFDSLNVENAAELELGVTGHTYRLRGALGAEIPGLPTSRFPDAGSRGEGAALQRFSQNPAAYDYDPSVVLDRLGRTPLVVECSDWEHFNIHKEKVQQVQMGTYHIGLENRVDPEKIAAYDKILTLAEAAGHRFVACREALEIHPPAAVLELIDGRDYTKNDLTRLVDACAWYKSRQGGLSERKDPHRMSDQESYSYSFGGARAWQCLKELAGAGAPVSGTELDGRTKDVLISFCSAHRSGGEDFTIRQQLLDRTDRVIESARRHLENFIGEDELFLPAGLPAGLWPLPVNLSGRPPAGYELRSGRRRAARAWLEAAATHTADLERSHQLWVAGPVPAGRYRLEPTARPAGYGAGLKVREDEDGLRLEGRSGFLRLDRFNGGGLAGWELRGFAPFARLGRLEFNSCWQEAPLVDEVPARFTWRELPFGVQVQAGFRIGDLDFRRTWLVGNDLAVCQLRLHCFHRSFSYLAPAVYRLNPAAFGRRGRFLMVAEGYTRPAAEPLARFHQIHHLGSELVGFAAPGGLAGLAVNRLVSSPILRRRPLSGTLVLMDSRPIGAADNAYPYQFAREPELELTLRLAAGSGEPLKLFREWQTFQDRPALLRLGRPPLQTSRLEWTKSIPGLTEVNPYF